MPLLAMMTSTVQFGTKTETKLGSGEKVPNFDYTGATPYVCRWFDRQINPRYEGFGQMIDVDAIALVPITTPVAPVPLTTTGSGQRQQCQIVDKRTNTTTTWEILRARDLGQKHRVLEVALKRWVL